MSPNKRASDAQKAKAISVKYPDSRKSNGLVDHDLTTGMKP
jgi:hypothetical protein